MSTHPKTPQAPAPHVHENPAIQLRAATLADAEICGRICYEAFRSIATKHAFPPDFAAPEIAVAAVSKLVTHPSIYGVVAEREGRIIGSNFLDERSSINGVGPITVDPQVQDAGVGRALMQHVLERARKRHAPGVRLVQSTYHNRSLSLYAKLGFDVREPLSVLSGELATKKIQGLTVRPGAVSDAVVCDRICIRVHGHHRNGEVRDALKHGTLNVVERAGAVAGYSTLIGYFGHAVGETWEEVAALIGAAPEFFGPGVIVPSRSSALLRWCLENGLRVKEPLTLMTMGLYNEPQGAWLPSIFF